MLLKCKLGRLHRLYNRAQCPRVGQHPCTACTLQSPNHPNSTFHETFIFNLLRLITWVEASSSQGFPPCRFPCLLCWLLLTFGSLSSSLVYIPCYVARALQAFACRRQGLRDATPVWTRAHEPQRSCDKCWEWLGNGASPGACCTGRQRVVGTTAHAARGAMALTAKPDVLHPATRRLPCPPPTPPPSRTAWLGLWRI